MQQRSSSTRRRVNGDNDQEEEEIINRQPSVTSPIDINNRRETRHGGVSARSGAEAFKRDIDAYSHQLTRTAGDGIFEGRALPSAQCLVAKSNNDRLLEKEIVTQKNIINRLGQSTSSSEQSWKQFKLTRRVVAAVIMFISFISMLFAGHELIACFVVLLQVYSL